MKLVATRQGRTDKADQAIHAEAVVESLQAQLWNAGPDSGAFDDAMFLEGRRCPGTARWRWSWPSPERYPPIHRTIAHVMHKPGRILSALALLLPALSHAAGDAGSCRYVPITKIDIDYSDQTRRVSVTGSINGEPVRMMVDTGAYESRLLRRGADRLGLTLESTGRYTYGVSGAAITYRTHVDDFALGASHTGKTVVPVLDLPGETRHEAIIGADFLLQADMELSLADKTMQFFRASGCADTFLAYWDRNAMEVPFIGKDGDSNKPYVAVELNGVKLTALLDTGAPRTTVTRHAAELAGVRVDAPGVRKAGHSHGIGDKVLDNWVADFKRFRIGDETVNNPQLVIRDDPPQSQARVDVLLGIDFLRAHHVLFAMSQDRLYLSYLGSPLFGATQQVPAAAPAAPPKTP